MYLGKYCLAVFFLFLVMSRPVSAADSKCSYSKSVKQGGTAFDISSRPANGCAVQIVTVTVRKGGKNIAVMKADVDYLANSAQAVDLTGDGTPELAVASRTTGGVVTESLDVYWLDGTNLRRSTVPELDEKSGYRGGDRFHLDGRLIVRTIPVYREGDTAGKPQGGTRLIKYKFKEGSETLYVQTEKTPEPSGAPAVESAPQSARKSSLETMPVLPVAAAPAITGITAGEAGIEIRGDGPIEKFKVMKLEKPERIAIDLPGATSNLIGRKITLNKFGISKVRVGRNNGFLRIVLDTTLGTFPKYEVKSSGTGILVEFTQ